FDLPEKLQFNRDIRTIFSKTCFACHGPDANTREAELRLDRREEAIATRDGVRPIVPGSAADSLAYQLITAGDPDDQMPPADFHTQLSPREKAMIRKWIDQGAEYEKHWAFIPPVKEQAPKVEHEGAVRNPIDRFVISKLEAEGFAPAAETDRPSIIRRVTLDLTGLPPTLDEIDAFVGDASDDAYEKVIDRLLASPRFGEHRARHWLDVARYADTSGYQYDKIRHQWVWRDWVINAFNTNMPFDQFTIEQNAGDLLPDTTDQTRLATGFHRNHPITIEGGVIDEEYRTEYVMDRVVTTTTAWLGLTFTCARCHDHKYDPIGQDDFYSFYAFFNSVPERGLNGFAPKAKIASPLAQEAATGLDAKMAEAQRRFDQALTKVSGSLDGWESTLRKSVTAESNAVKFDTLTAGGGTKLVQLADGSVLASGPNPATQTYQVDFTLGELATRAIRLEALTHESHINQSTGRGNNGNFVLSEVEFYTAARGAPDSDLKPVPIIAAEASYQQSGYPITAAIDATAGRNGWAVDGNTRFADSTAVFTLGTPIAAGSRVRVRLVHTWGGAHTIGRFKLSIPVDGQAPVPGEIQKTLALTRLDRSAAQQKTLEIYLAERYGAAGFAEVSSELRALATKLAATKVDVPETMILASMPKPRTTHVLMRGEYDKAIEERVVEPDVPKALGGLPAGLPRNRLGLAKWLVSADNPLTARVTVNRFWAQLFGTGIVKTVEDFGSQGEYPTHPELLDWLALGFVESGWDVKQLFKAIVTSGTYRQSSQLTPESHAIDPDNRLLARGPRFRLDAESIRDSALAVGGLLDGAVGGPSVYPYHPEGLWLEINNRPGYSRAYPQMTAPSHLYRRSMYTFWKRTVPPPSMATFDAPEREYCVAQRSRTNTPLQAFVMLHDPQFVEAARKLAERMLHEAGPDPAQRLAHGFTLCMARQPTARELQLLRRALDERMVQFKADPAAAAPLLKVGQSPHDAKIDPAELAAYATVARIIMNLSEFITKG
ncbi:MAG: hypothetical protein ACI9NC_004915, partial [Verrucomicrobiales bacterium]